MSKKEAYKFLLETNKVEKLVTIQESYLKNKQVGEESLLAFLRDGQPVPLQTLTMCMEFFEPGYVFIFD